MFIVNVEGAVYRGDRWLLIRRSAKEAHAGGTLSLVGGKAEPGDGSQELLERALRRELLEEVGIEAKSDAAFLYSSSFVTDAGEQVANVVFVCEHDSGEAHCRSPEEVEAVYWLTAEEVAASSDAPPWTKESIRRAEQARLRRAPAERRERERRGLTVLMVVILPIYILTRAAALYEESGPLERGIDLFVLIVSSVATGAFFHDWFMKREKRVRQEQKSGNREGG